MAASAVWLGSALLFFIFHRFGLQVTLGVVLGILVLALVIKHRILPLGPLEDWYDDFLHSRRVARMQRQAREEQIAADPVNQEILYLQQFASPGLMLMLKPEEFFDLTVRYFRLLGYARRHQRIFLGGPTDSILRQGEDLYVLRALWWAEGAIDVPEVRSLSDILDGNNCVGGVLVTNTSFTAEAEAAAVELKVTLLDGDTLAGSISAFQLRDPTIQKPVRRKKQPPQ